MKKIFKTILALLALLMSQGLMAQSSLSFSHVSGDGTTNMGYGPNTPNNLPLYYHVCMKLDNPDWEGMKVEWIQLSECVTFDGAKYNMWTSDALPQTGLVNGHYVDTMETVPDMRVLLGYFTGEKPVIGKDGMYIGFDLEVSKVLPDEPGKLNRSYYPMCLFLPRGKANTMLMDITTNPNPSKYNWTDYNSPELPLEKQRGCIYLWVILSGQGKEYAVAINGVTGETAFVKEMPVTLTVSATNYGQHDVSSLGYSYTVDGNTITGTQKLPEPFAPGSGTKKDITFDLPALTVAGNHPYVFTITEVDGHANESKLNVLESDFCVPEFNARKRVIMEEGTGTWCGWCPRGSYAMSALKEELGDNFIGVAYHQRDPMEVGKLPMDYGAGFPGCSLDRTVNALDPYYGDDADLEKDMRIRDIVNKQIKAQGYANLGLETHFNADKTRLDIKGNAVFGGARDTEYRLGYILVQNDLQVTDNDDFDQKNFLAGKDGTGSPLEFLTKQPAVLADYVYQDVVINSTAAAGVENSLPKDITLSKLYSHDFSLPCGKAYSSRRENDGTYTYPQTGSEYNLAQNPDKMEVVMVLIDGEGHVVNSIKVKAGDSTPVPQSAVTDIATDATTPVYYDLQGRRVANPRHGIFIRKQGAVAMKVIKD